MRVKWWYFITVLAVAVVTLASLAWLESMACWNHNVSKTLQLSGNSGGSFCGYRGSTDPSTVTSSTAIFTARWRRRDLTPFTGDFSITLKKLKLWQKTSETCVEESLNCWGGCWMLCRQQGSPVSSLRCRVRFLDVNLTKNHFNGTIKVHSMFKWRSNPLRGTCELLHFIWHLAPLAPSLALVPLGLICISAYYVYLPLGFSFQSVFHGSKLLLPCILAIQSSLSPPHSLVHPFFHHKAGHILLSLWLSFLYHLSSNKAVRFQVRFHHFAVTSLLLC